MTRKRPDWLSPAVRAAMKEARAENCGICGAKRKTYPLLGRNSKVLMCPVCDDEENILRCCKQFMEDE